MQVRDVMTRDAECIRPEDTLQKAAQKMKALDCGCLPVCDNNRLTGMITDRDIIIRSVAEGRDPATQRTREVMTPKVIACTEDQDVAEAAQLMRENQIRRLPVLGQDRQIVGIVSLGDLALEAHDEHLVGSTLEGVSEPGQPW
jgi:CBS domain-containing protein